MIMRKTFPDKATSKVYAVQIYFKMTAEMLQSSSKKRQYSLLLWKETQEKNKPI